MNNSMKIAFLKKQLKEYKNKNATLIEENKALYKENQSLRDKNSSISQIIDSLERRFNEVNDLYQENLAELKQLRQKYFEAAKSISLLKTEYKKQVEQLLKRLRKQK